MPRLRFVCLQCYSGQGDEHIEMQLYQIETCWKHRKGYGSHHYKFEVWEGAIERGMLILK